MRLALLSALLFASLVPTTVAAQQGTSAGTAQLVGALSTAIPVGVGGVLMLTSDDAAAAGFLVASAGMVLGPTIGNITGHLGTRAVVGTLVRGGLWLGASYLLVLWGNDETGSAEAYLAGSLAGYAALTGIAVWDIATIPGAMRKRGAAQVGVTPMWMPATRAPGLALNVKF